jgi:thiamine kinase-like enzyme
MTDKNIQARVAKISSQLGCKITKKYEQSNGLDYFVAQGEISGGKTVLIKIVSLKHHKAENVQKEILASEIIKKHNSMKLNDKFNFPAVLYSDKDDEFVWIIRELIPGMTLSLSNRAYDELRNNLANDQLIEKIITNYTAFSKIDITGYRDLIKDYSFCVKSSPNELGKKYSCDENLKISYGDLNPGNIIISDDGKVYFTDLEWLSLDNKMMDIAYFWAFLWRYPELQIKWFNKFVTSAEAKEFFRLSIIRMFMNTRWEDKEFFNNPIFKERNEKWYSYYKQAQSLNRIDFQER